MNIATLEEYLQPTDRPLDRVVSAGAAAVPVIIGAPVGELLFAFVRIGFKCAVAVKHHLREHHEGLAIVDGLGGLWSLVEW
jgi:hypothetical protein